MSKPLLRACASTRGPLGSADVNNAGDTVPTARRRWFRPATFILPVESLGLKKYDLPIRVVPRNVAGVSLPADAGGCKWNRSAGEPPAPTVQVTPFVDSGKGPRGQAAVQE